MQPTTLIDVLLAIARLFRWNGFPIAEEIRHTLHQGRASDLMCRKSVIEHEFVPRILASSKRPSDKYMRHEGKNDRQVRENEFLYGLNWPETGFFCFLLVNRCSSTERQTGLEGCLQQYQLYQFSVFIYTLGMHSLSNAFQQLS